MTNPDAFVSPYLLRPLRHYEEALRDRMRNNPGRPPRAATTPAPGGTPTGDSAPVHGKNDLSARPQTDRKAQRHGNARVADSAGPR